MNRLLFVSAAAASLCVWSGLTAASAIAATAPSHVPATQALTEVLVDHSAYRSPTTSSPRVDSVPAQTPITGDHTTLPVIGQTTDAKGTRWLKVMLPGRPNGRTGWISAGATHELDTGWHIYVSLSDRRLSIYLHGRMWRTFSADIGNASTPTPTGNFFVQETVIMPAADAGGPFALALSARSTVLQQFNGGPGQIAIHGLNFIGGPLGQALSHGCVRLATPAITWLANRIGPGVPVSIEA